mmetsp:Transcript_12414/g.37999  ORF Transcript_12414/g.37999 Transcript_12414/m.37999 type:complete len:223 (-) Transcript_12414:868-1536(-)
MASMLQRQSTSCSLTGSRMPAPQQDGTGESVRSPCSIWKLSSSMRSVPTTLRPRECTSSPFPTRNSPCVTRCGAATQRSRSLRCKMRTWRTSVGEGRRVFSVRTRATSPSFRWAPSARPSAVSSWCASGTPTASRRWAASSLSATLTTSCARSARHHRLQRCRTPRTRPRSNLSQLLPPNHRHTWRCSRFSKSGRRSRCLRRRYRRLHHWRGWRYHRNYLRA